VRTLVRTLPRYLAIFASSGLTNTFDSGRDILQLTSDASRAFIGDVPIINA
jgi:hypothetical protein